MWPTIISTFLALATEWIQGCGKDPVAEAKAAYDPGTDTFSKSAVRGATIQMRHAIHLSKAHMSHAEKRDTERLKPSEIRERTIQAMRQGLTATPADVTRFATMAQSLPDDVDHTEALPEIDHEVSEE